MCGQSNLQRKTVTSRAAGKLLRLLHETSCFEVILNRRMPNGIRRCERRKKISPIRFITES